MGEVTSPRYPTPTSKDAERKEGASSTWRTDRIADAVGGTGRHATSVALEHDCGSLFDLDRNAAPEPLLLATRPIVINSYPTEDADRRQADSEQHEPDADLPHRHVRARSGGFIGSHKPPPERGS
jgi:hypothetical protein